MKFVVTWRWNNKLHVEKFDNWLDANLRFFKLHAEGKDPSFHDGETEDLNDWALYQLIDK